MQAPFDNIVQHLFHQPSLYSVTVDELENMAVQHPYFAAAHFLLLKKMQDTDHPGFVSQLHKTTLYFNNPLWLQFLLQPETVADFSISEKPPFITSDSIIEPSHTIEENKNNLVHEDVFHNETIEQSFFNEEQQEHTVIDTTEAETTEAKPEIIPAEHGGSMMDIITEIFSDPNPLYNAVVPEETINNEVHEETIAEHTESITDQHHEQIAEHEQPAIEEINTIVPEETNADHTEATIDQHYEQIAEHEQPAIEEINTVVPEETIAQHTEAKIDQHHEQIAEHEQPAVEEINTIVPEETNADHTEATTEPNHEQIAEHEQPAIEEINTIVPEENTIWPVDESLVPAAKTIHEDEHVEISAPIPSEIYNEEIQVNTEVAEHSNQQDSPGTIEADATEPEITTDQHSNEPATSNAITGFLKTIIETPAAKSDLLFEPYHTVDYFASQGIKLSKAEVDSKDKLGRQLKSFTEWLKTMKRIPQASIDKMLAENEESKVVADAIHSIENKEVITETMAEVFEKQGLNDKAVEVYEKLSLLNPQKSAYFAARIEALKN